MKVLDETDIVHVRNMARLTAQEPGFGEVRIDELTNPHNGIRITFVDQCPGIENIELPMKDSWSSSGGMGMGLPGAKRLMDHMEIQPKRGEDASVIVEK